MQKVRGRKLGSSNQASNEEIAHRRDEAVRRALNTPPKPHKDMKKGKQKATPTASSSPEKKP